MSPLTFRGRLTIQWTVSFGLLLACAAGAIYIGARAYLYEELQAQLLTLAATETASSTDGPGGIHLHVFPIAATDGLRYADKFAQILTPEGQVVRQTRELAQRGPLLDETAIRRTLAGEAPVVNVSMHGRAGRVTALATESGGETYIVAVGVYTDHLEATLAKLARMLGAVWLAGLALTGVLGFTLSSHVLAPIDRIARQARAIARGSFSARLDPPEFDDEIGRMTVLLNEMLSRLQDAVLVNQRFAADASHELRGPLTAIRGEIDVTLRRPREPSEYRQTLEQIRQRADELTALTSDLTLLVRAREGNGDTPIKEVALVPLVRASAERLSELVSANGVSIRFEGFPDLVAYANPALLARVFDNLLGNAVQYNRSGGSVIIGGTVEAAPSGDWRANVATVWIRDTGLGIQKRDRERVFERFFRIDRSRSRRTGGTGLGLSICREVLALFQGTVRVADSSPEGTTIEVRLPGTTASEEILDSDVAGSPRHALT